MNTLRMQIVTQFCSRFFFLFHFHRPQPILSRSAYYLDKETIFRVSETNRVDGKFRFEIRKKIKEIVRCKFISSYF